MEHIAAVAIKMPDGSIRTKERPARHHELIHDLYEETGEVVTGQQGFVTNEGRFVERKEAYIIAIKADQLDPKRTLFSEDVW